MEDYFVTKASVLTIKMLPRSLLLKNQKTLGTPSTQILIVNKLLIINESAGMISFILASFEFLFISFWSENADILFSLLRCSARKLKCIRNSKIRIN